MNVESPTNESRFILMILDDITGDGDGGDGDNESESSEESYQESFTDIPVTSTASMLL